MNGKADGRISVWVGLEHMFYAVPAAWDRATRMTHEYQVGLHTHSNESRFDVEETGRRYQMRPIEALEKFGLLGAHKVMLAHCVWLADEEIALLKAHNVSVAHNPISNMKLASGAAPVTKLLAAGIAVGLGTDGEKENNNLDMFEEMKVSSLLAKFSALDAVEMLPGVKVRFVEDASRGIDPEGVRAAIEEMRSRGVEIVTSDEALAG